jgi:hypothetical protein
MDIDPTTSDHGERQNSLPRLPPPHSLRHHRSPSNHPADESHPHGAQAARSGDGVVYDGGGDVEGRSSTVDGVVYGGGGDAERRSSSLARASARMSERARRASLVILDASRHASKAIYEGNKWKPWEVRCHTRCCVQMDLCTQWVVSMSMSSEHEL